MFTMFGFGGVACPRCEHNNASDSGYCGHCGMTLGAPRNPVVLRENRWVAGPNELAVFFGVRELRGLFVKTLRVPASTRAYILQGDKATEVPQGEYEIEGFFERLNNLLRDQHAEILITRTNALPVLFDFDQLQTAELLKVSASFTVSVKVDHVAAFGQHFMTLPGAVSTDNLRELLAPSVRQLAAEFVAGQSIRDMAANRDLRPQLDERLQGALKQRLAEYGLAVVQVDTLALRHDKFDANRERIGTLWLVADERHVRLEHVKQLDQIYSDEEWQGIYRAEQDARLRHRRAELRQDESVERAELHVQEAERVQAIRARQVDLYGRIVESRSRKQAIDCGAGDALAELEHAMAAKGSARANDELHWAHVRQLAQFRMQAELEAARQDAMQAHQLARQRFSHQLVQQQIQNKISQALLIEDEGRKRAQLLHLHRSEVLAQERDAELAAERHAAARQSLVLAHAAHARAAERVKEWEDQLALDRQRELLRADMLKDASAKAQAEEVSQKIEAMRRSGAQADALAQYEKLLRTIDAEGVHARQGQQAQRQALLDQLEVDQQRHGMKEREQKAQWEQELRRLEHAREEKFALWKSEYATLVARQGHEIAHAQTIGALGDSAKLALAAAPNAAALADVMKTVQHAGMRADQLGALAGVVAAGGGVTPLEAARQAQDQVQQARAQREEQLERERRHQLDLLAMQNQVNQAALAAQSQLGIGIAQGALAGHHSGVQGSCVNGHVVRSGDRFCPECGALMPLGAAVTMPP
ncbi:MAG: SPFH domain-containing protein [Pseudomonadota bacterium]